MNIIQAILNLFFGGNKKKEVKELDKQIKVKDQEVKELPSDVRKKIQDLRRKFSVTEPAS
jgi:hypothetical protein